MSIWDLTARVFGNDGVQVLIAGAAGGVVRWLTLRSNWRDGSISLFVGAICSYYLNPLAQPIVEAVLGHFVVDPSARLSFSGFMIGIGGIGVAGFAMDLIRGGIRRKTSGDQGQ